MPREARAPAYSASESVEPSSSTTSTAGSSGPAQTVDFWVLLSVTASLPPAAGVTVTNRSTGPSSPGSNVNGKSVRLYAGMAPTSPSATTGPSAESVLTTTWAPAASAPPLLKTGTDMSLARPALTGWWPATALGSA